MRLWPALLLAVTPLAGMMCDDPRTPCLRVMSGLYLLILSTVGDLFALLLFALLLFANLAAKTSWKATLWSALLFNAVNWAVYALALGPEWHP